MIPENHIWIFTGAIHHSPGGVFTTVEKAEAWIRANRLSGTLSAYPVDQGCLDWAIEAGAVNMKPEKLETKRSDPNFIASFSTASQEHWHYRNGERN
jgi:hypothetical protein